MIFIGTGAGKSHADLIEIYRKVTDCCTQLNHRAWSMERGGSVAGESAYHSSDLGLVPCAAVTIIGQS